MNQRGSNGETGRGLLSIWSRPDPSDNLSRRTGPLEIAGVQPSDPLTQAANLAELVADENHSSARASNITHLPKAFPLELYVTNRKDLIHQQDFRFKVSSNRKGYSSNPRLRRTGC